MEKHFVTFLSPGTFVAEDTTISIDSWDVDKAIELSKKVVERYGAKPYAFYFSTKSRGENDLDSKVTAESGCYFINGVIETLEQVETRNDPNDRILISNMRSNGWDKIVVTNNSYRWVQPFNEKEDHIVSVS